MGIAVTVCICVGTLNFITYFNLIANSPPEQWEKLACPLNWFGNQKDRAPGFESRKQTSAKKSKL